MTDRVSLSLRVPPDLHAELTRQAEARMVSVNLIVTRAIADFLDRLDCTHHLVRGPHSGDNPCAFCGEVIVNQVDESRGSQTTFPRKS